MGTAHPLPVDPVAAALARAPEGAPFTPDELRFLAEQVTMDGDFDDITPEERAELRRRVAAAKGRAEPGIPLEKFLADRGMG
jgi:hypothetical protein